jgi:hypothetical protein
VRITGSSDEISVSRACGVTARREASAVLDGARRTSTPVLVVLVVVEERRSTGWPTPEHRRPDPSAAARTILQCCLGTDSLVLRFDLDTFLCTVPGDMWLAAAAVERARRVFARLLPSARVSIGEACQFADDTINDLVARAELDREVDERSSKNR